MAQQSGDVESAVKISQEEEDPEASHTTVGSIMTQAESYLPPLQRKIILASDVPNMTPEQLKDFILMDTSTVPANTALVTVGGLPSCGKSGMMQKLLQKHAHMELKDMVTEHEVTTRFSFFELAAVQEKETMSWEWYPFAQHSGYLSCFLSALGKDTSQDQQRQFALQPNKQYLFNNDVLDSWFYSLYDLLSSLYHDESAASIRRQLTGGTSLSLINVWDIGLNGAILHFLTILAGYLHHNVPILALSFSRDAEYLHEHIDTSNLDKLKWLQPILHQYSRGHYLLQFSHLGRKNDEDRRGVCGITAIVHPDDQPSKEEHDKRCKMLSTGISEAAKKLRATDLIHGSPSIVDPGNDGDLRSLKENIDKLIQTGKQKSNLPLSWVFLRSAFFKTGQLYIERSRLEKCAKECRITGDNFTKFLHEFTGFGSIIHIPDIPVLCDYVILNPVDFFHKLNELFYPRFNGDLKYGIASFSTLRRMFGGDLQFFCDVLTSCSFAVEIDSSRIVYAEKEKRLPIAERYLYIPTIRTGKPGNEDRTPLDNSLLLMYKETLMPTRTTENAVKYLVEKESNLSLKLLTCECYTVTKFHYKPQPERTASRASPPRIPSAPVTLTLISHGDKNEIRIENDEDGATHIKKQVIRAYREAIDSYSKRHLRLLGCNPDIDFALVCQSNLNQHHYFSESDKVCPACKDNPTFQSLWSMWNAILQELYYKASS